jgi:SAM-dependent methyltransferase
MKAQDDSKAPDRRKLPGITNSADRIHYFGRDLEAMSFAKNYYKWLIDEVGSFLGDDVAEIGAGRGNFSSFLLNTDIKRLIAFEPSENMFASLQRRFQNQERIQIVNAFLHDYPGGGTEPFDTAIYINVLEHVADDAKELALVHNCLKTRGHAIILVPALSILYSGYDKQLGHYRRYHRRELMDKVTAAGFTVVEAKYLDFLGVIPWFLAFRVLRLSLTGGSVALYDRLCIPIVKRIESMLRMPFGKNLLLVAEKI